MRSFKKFMAYLLSVVLLAGFLPAVNVEASVSPDPNLLVSLTRTTASAAEAGNKFTADDGVFASISELTAWDDNTQITIGGTGRTPIVINNGALGTGRGWTPAAGTASDQIAVAPAFQLKFSTTGHNDIRFSCTQKSTGSGPDAFALAYSLDGDNWVAIPNSTTGTGAIPAVHRVGNDTYAALKITYLKFQLPDEVNDEDEVYLRVYFVGNPNLGRNGNTSINDIRITTGDANPYPGLLPEVRTFTFSKESGFYKNAFDLELDVDFLHGDGVIRYTTDGSEPTASSTLYDEDEKIRVEDRTGKPDEIMIPFDLEIKVEGTVDIPTTMAIIQGGGRP